MEFRVGDRVTAVGRGLPTLTVAEVYHPLFPYRYLCTWADASGVDRLELFRDDQLVAVGTVIVSAEVGSEPTWNFVAPPTFR